jgi:hypothetical protein
VNKAAELHKNGQKRTCREDKIKSLAGLWRYVRIEQHTNIVQKCEKFAKMSCKNKIILL